MCVNMCAKIWVNMLANICLNMRANVSANVCAHRCANVCADAFVGMHAETGTCADMEADIVMAYTDMAQIWRQT